MADIYEMMSTLRAVRRLRPDAVPEAVIQRVLQAAAWAPTGGNQQPWRVIVVRDETRKAKLAQVYRPHWYRFAENYKAAFAQMADDQRAAQERMLAACDHLADHLAEVPVILMFIADPARMAITDEGLDRVSMIGGASVYTAVQNAMLAARTEGLGCVLTTLHCFDERAVQEALDIPPNWATVAMVPLGYPQGTGHGPISRRPPSKLAYDDSFNVAWTDVPLEANDEGSS